MHNIITRIQNVFGFFTTVAGFVALAITILSLVTTPVPDLKETSLLLNNVQVVKGRPHYYSQKKEEYAHIRFDLDVDLSTLFTWNTKQIFLYITATYPSTSTNPTTPPSTAVIWDAILPHPLSPSHENQYIVPTTSKSKSKSKTAKSTIRSSNAPSSQGLKPGILQLEAQRPKYQITDPSGKLAERSNATLELHWNVQPWVGVLTWGGPSGVVGSGNGGESWLSKWTWRELVGGVGRTKGFMLPSLKDKKDATKEAGELGTAKGGERNRGKPA